MQQPSGDQLEAFKEGLRTEFFQPMRGDMNQLKQELRGDMNQLKQELRGDMGKLKKESRSDMEQLKQESRSDMDQMMKMASANSDSLGVLVNVAAADGVAPRGDEQRPRALTARSVSELLAALAPACGSAEEQQRCRAALCEQLALHAWPLTLDMTATLAAPRRAQARSARACPRLSEGHLFSTCCARRLRRRLFPAGRRRRRRARIRRRRCRQPRTWLSCS